MNSCSLRSCGRFPNIPTSRSQSHRSKNGLEAIVGEKLPVAVPDIVFENKLTLVLGGETVILNHIAPSHSNSRTVITFPHYKAMQLTDIGESNTMPYNDFLDFYYDGWIKTLDWALKQDVNYIDVGYVSLGFKSQAWLMVILNGKTPWTIFFIPIITI